MSRLMLFELWACGSRRTAGRVYTRYCHELAASLKQIVHISLPSKLPGYDGAECIGLSLADRFLNPFVLSAEGPYTYTE